MFIFISTLLAVFDISVPDEGNLTPEFTQGLIRCAHTVLRLRTSADTCLLKLPASLQLQDHAAISVEGYPSVVPCGPLYCLNATMYEYISPVLLYATSRQLQAMY